MAIDGSDLTLPYNPKEENVIGDNYIPTLHFNALLDVGNKKCIDAIVQKGLKEKECDAACELADRITGQYPVIIMADRRYGVPDIENTVLTKLNCFVIIRMNVQFDVWEANHV